MAHKRLAPPWGISQPVDQFKGIFHLAIQALITTGDNGTGHVNRLPGGFRMPLWKNRQQLTHERLCPMATEVIELFKR